MSTAVAWARGRKRTIGTMPAQIAGACAIKTRPVIRAVHGAQQVRRHPLDIAVIAIPPRVANTGLVDTRTVRRAVAITLVSTPVN
jgi:hypothetical protein